PGDRPPDTEAQFRKEVAAAYAPMGVEPVADFWAAPRPDLNGLRVKLPNRPEIYLIDRGYRRWIPNPATYNNPLRHWNGIIVGINGNAEAGKSRYSPPLCHIDEPICPLFPFVSTAAKHRPFGGLTTSSAHPRRTSYGPGSPKVGSAWRSSAAPCRVMWN